MSDLARIAGVALVLLVCATVPLTAQETAQAEGTTEDAAQDKSASKKMFGESSTSDSETSAQTVIIDTYTYSSAVRNTQARLRKTQAVEHPEVRRSMSLVDSGFAGPVDLASFGNLLASRGFLEIAVVYLNEALRFDPQNATYWTNLGTVARHQGDNSTAIDAYRKAIAIDPGMAIAQYNLGVAYDAQGKYDRALEQYVRAFTLDPSLADPRVNPQVVNNLSLPAASLLLYQRLAGNQALPLIPVGEENLEGLQINIPISD